MGDDVYGPHFKTKASHLGPESQAALTGLGRQALHAYLLALEHPRTGRNFGVDFGFARRSGPFERLSAGGAMTQGSLKSAAIPKAYISHTVT